LTIAGEGVRVATFSGQIGAPATGAGEQTRQVFDAIGNLLASQGAGPDDLIKLTTYVVGFVCR
jgi:enamine deaminase RidA (YjgF/YER057c/UK114 family)